MANGINKQVLQSGSSINKNYFDFDTTPTGVPTQTGVVSWNSAEDTLDLQATNIVYQLGQEIAPLYKNQTGSTITNGTPVMFAGSLGASGRITIQKALANGSLPAMYTIGITTEDIADGSDGHVTWFGKVRGLNTTGSLYGETWNDGDIIYVSPTTAGYLTKTKPNAPNLQIVVAAVVNAHSNNGTLFVRPTWGFKLEDLDNVNGTALTTSGQIPVWNQTTGYFDFTSNINNYVLSSGLQETIEDVIGTKVVAGTNITVSYNDTTGETTINGTGGGGSTGKEVILDLGDIPIYSKGVQFTDAEITPTSKIIMTPHADSDELEMDGFTVAVTPMTGTAIAYIQAIPGPVTGTKKFNYLIT